MSFSLATKPFVLVFLTAIYFYGITLPILTSRWDSRAAEILVCVLWYLYALFFVHVAFDFTNEFFRYRMNVRDSLWGFFNMIIAGLHVLASLGMSIWLLDKGAFVGIVDDSNRFAIFYTYFFTTAGDFLLQDGFKTAVPANGSAAGATFGIIGGLFSIFFTVIIFTLITRPVQRAIFSGSKKSNPIRV